MAEEPRKKDEMKFVGVQIPENLRRVIKAQASLEGRTLSELVTDALKQYMAGTKKKN